MNEQLTIGSLFSGIGGLEIGFHKTGRFRTVWSCDIAEYPNAVLAERWGLPNLGDITKVDWSTVKPVDVLVGGFPCQDISNAGQRAGIIGSRSGLWKEYLRAIKALKPRFVVAENVAALVTRGLDVVVDDLNSAGYRVEARIISARDVGAPHLRKRIFIIAHRTEDSERERENRTERESTTNDTNQDDKVSNSSGGGLEAGGERGVLREAQGLRPVAVSSFWTVEPDVGRVVNGVPRGLDSYVWRERSKALGNAVVPQVAEEVAKRVIELNNEKEVRR